MAASPPAQTFNVVIAYDGSEHAEYALDWYKDHLHRPHHHVTLVHVPELNEMLHSTRWANSVYVFDRDVLEGMLKEEQERIRKELEKYAEKLKGLGLGGKVKSVASAKPGEGIVKESEDAKMVVVGSRGLGAVRRTLLGSVGDYLVHHCHCPVVVVKHPKHFHLHGVPADEPQQTKQ
ncbi:universal stress protein Slr1101-like [Babylonia areolata]|uniref:universal stress protein Slr1101-like n=1 Tax=Babylonia areolata TaxID=304850 RepID=UPI003FD347CB